MVAVALRFRVFLLTEDGVWGVAVGGAEPNSRQDGQFTAAGRVRSASGLTENHNNLQIHLVISNRRLVTDFVAYSKGCLYRRWCF